MEKIKNIVIIVLLILAGLQLFKSCKDARDFEDAKKLLINDAKVYSAELIDKQNRIYQVEQDIVERNKYIDALLDTISNLRNITSTTRIVTKTKIDTVKVPYEVPVYITKNDYDYIRVPMPFNKQTKWYGLTGFVGKKEIEFTNVNFNNDLFIAVGEHDYGNGFANFFRRKRFVVNVRDNNPYTTITGIRQTTINNPKQNIIIGPQVGYSVKGAYIGVGLTYNVLGITF